jgi:hypothetical protein
VCGDWFVEDVLKYAGMCEQRLWAMLQAIKHENAQCKTGLDGREHFMLNATRVHAPGGAACHGP